MAEPGASEGRFAPFSDFESRDGGLTRDPVIWNGFLEKGPPPQAYVRPGLGTYVVATNTPGQGFIIGGTTGARVLRVAGGIIDIAV